MESPFTSRTAWTWGAAALLGFFAAGLSETFAAMQTGGLALAIVAVLFFAPRAERGRRGAGLAAALAGSLLMMLVMALAPANAWRQDVMPPPDNLLLILPTSLRFAADFILYSVRGQITPFLVYAALLGTLGLLGIPTGEVKVSPRAGLVGAFGSLGVMYALIVCSFAPSAYAALSYPAGRALMPGSFILLAGLGCAALLLGLTLRSLVPAGRQGWLAAGALALLLLLSLYPLRALAVVRQDIGRLAVRAERWDARNTQIRQALAAGNQDLTVPQVDVVQGLEDIGPDSTQWVNNCASAFYGARSITAKP